MWAELNETSCYYQALSSAMTQVCQNLFIIYKWSNHIFSKLKYAEQTSLLAAQGVCLQPLT